MPKDALQTSGVHAEGRLGLTHCVFCRAFGHGFFRLLFSLAEDDDDEASSDPDAELNSDPSFGKAFLVPRVKIPSYDLDIYTPGLLQARGKVGTGFSISS